VNRSKGRIADIIDVAILASGTSTPRVTEYAFLGFEVEIYGQTGERYVADLLSRTRAATSYGVLVASDLAASALLVWDDASSPVAGLQTFADAISGGRVCASAYGLPSDFSGVVLAGAPSVFSVTPNTGAVGSFPFVTISGANFLGTSAVTIAGSNVLSFIVVNSSTITAQLPNGSTGSKTVAVTTPAGTGSLVAAFTYTAAGSAPTVTAISKSLGLTRGGQAVSITVNDSTGCTGATVGGVALIGFAILDATHVTGTTGAGTAGANLSVTVTNASGTGTLTNAYEYWAPLSTNLAVWYDVGVSTVAAGKLTALPDQSGNGRNATLSGAGLAFTAANAGYGGIPTVNRADATDTIQMPSMGISTAPRTIVFIGDAPSAAYNYLVRGGGVDLRAQAGVFRGTDDGGATLLDSGAVTPTSPNVVVCVYNGASSRMYGKAATATTGGTGSLADLTGVGFTVGDAAGGGGGNLNFAHALVYNAGLSDAQCKELLRGFGALTSLTIGA
jgi:hypothetical protein